MYLHKLEWQDDCEFVNMQKEALAVYLRQHSGILFEKPSRNTNTGDGTVCIMVEILTTAMNRRSTTLQGVATGDSTRSQVSGSVFFPLHR
jgi:hypothetical protein